MPVFCWNYFTVWISKWCNTFNLLLSVLCIWLYLININFWQSVWSENSKQPLSPKSHVSLWFVWWEQLHSKVQSPSCSPSRDWGSLSFSTNIHVSPWAGHPVPKPELIYQLEHGQELWTVTRVLSPSICPGKSPDPAVTLGYHWPSNLLGSFLLWPPWGLGVMEPFDLWLLWSPNPISLVITFVLGLHMHGLGTWLAIPSPVVLAKLISCLCKFE
jgi:hypothetical protein